MGIINKILLKAILTNWNHYEAVLPYNLNWFIKLGPLEKKYLFRNPVFVCDVGARGGPPEELYRFFPYIEYRAFDADKEECERLNLASSPYKKFSISPYFIGGKKKTTSFHLYLDRSHSSIYNPSKRYQKLFGGDHFSTEKKIEVESTTLDEIYSTNLNNAPDLLKLDTQGSELEILSESIKILKLTCLVEVEVEFIEMYEGQPLFHDILKFMNDNGFELLYLNRVFCQRYQIFSGASRGQMIFGDALFGRREDLLADIDIPRLVKYTLLLINYGHIDFAFHLTKLYPAILMELPSIKKYFCQNGKNFLPKKWLVGQFDKFLLLMLHFRKYNQSFIDSDRSWPVR